VGKLTEVQFDSAMAAYVSSGFEYPSLLISAAPTSTPSSAWALEAVSATSDTTGWLDNGSSVFANERVPVFPAWTPSVNPYSSYPTADDSEPEMFPFEATPPYVSGAESQTPIWAPVYMDSTTQFAPQPFGGSTFAKNLVAKPYQDSSSSPSTVGRTPSPKSKPKSKPRKPTAKRDRVESLKRKAGADSAYPGDVLPSALPKAAEEILVDRFGQHMTAPEGSGPLTSEHIRREAWRICKAEAREMSERRMRLIEHEGGALEREAVRMQQNIAAMRDAISREQNELERAVAMAERMSCSQSP